MHDSPAAFPCRGRGLSILFFCLGAAKSINETPDPIKNDPSKNTSPCETPYSRLNASSWCCEESPPLSLRGIYAVVEPVEVVGSNKTIYTTLCFSQLVRLTCYCSLLFSVF